jgi:hypothetical protein
LLVVYVRLVMSFGVRLCIRKDGDAFGDSELESLLSVAGCSVASFVFHSSISS